MHTELITYTYTYKVVKINLELSTLWAHFQRKHSNNPDTLSGYSSTMSVEEGEYTIVHEDGNVEILDSAFINMDNIDQMSFSFEAPKDITESLNKNNSDDKDKDKGRNGGPTTTNGRVAYGAGQVTYPNGKESSKKISLTGCIVQYRPGVNIEKSRYAKSFITIGIPQLYIGKIISDAKDNSSVNLSVKSGSKLIDAYYWIDCNLEKLSVNNTFILYPDGSGGAKRIQRDVHTILKSFAKNITATILFTLSASASTTMMQEKIDLTEGMFNITIKPTEIVFTDISTIEGPTLDDTNRRKKEHLEATETLLASSELARMAMEKLGIA